MLDSASGIVFGFPDILSRTSKINLDVIKDLDDLAAAFET
jgi:hypothetical protein